MIRMREIWFTERAENGMDPQVFLHHIDHILHRILPYVFEIAARMVGSEVRDGVRDALDPFES